MQGSSNAYAMADIFKQLGVTCKPNPKAWWAEDQVTPSFCAATHGRCGKVLNPVSPACLQPSFVSGSTDPNHGDCVGYTNVPGGVLCAGSFPTTSRLCRCDEPSTQRLTFGTGLSAGHITQQEQWVFQHFVAPGDVGVMTHFWATVSSCRVHVCACVGGVRVDFLGCPARSIPPLSTLELSFATTLTASLCHPLSSNPPWPVALASSMLTRRGVPRYGGQHTHVACDSHTEMYVFCSGLAREQRTDHGF